MNRLRLEWSIFIKSLRVLKKNRRLLNLLVPVTVFCLLLWCLAAGTVQRLLSQPWDSITTGETVIAAVRLFLLLFAGIPVYRLISVFLTGIFYSEMIRGFGDDQILIKRGLLFAFIKRKALLKWALKGWMFPGKGNVFAVPTILCDEEAEEPSVIHERAAATVEHIWHPEGGFKGLIVLLILSCLFTAALPLLALQFARDLPPGTIKHAVMCLIPAAAAAALIFTGLVLTARKVYIAALFCYAHGPDEVGEFTREELKNGF